VVQEAAVQQHQRETRAGVAVGQAAISGAEPADFLVCLSTHDN
jgi:hypothetical protein